MKHLDFIMWICLFPVAEAIVAAIKWQWCERKEYTSDVVGWAAFIMTAFYLYVGHLIWKEQ